MGASVMLVGVQLSVPGSYFAPVPIAGVAVGVGVGVAPEGKCARDLPTALRSLRPLPFPPQTIILLPVQIAVWPDLAVGALAVLVANQLSVTGLYLPPVLVPPPQMIISLPVQTAVWPDLAVGALAVLTVSQLSVAGLYLPPLLKKKGGNSLPDPPQIIISLPVQTAV